MSGQAAEYAQDYAWENIAAQIVGAYKDLTLEESQPSHRTKRNGNG